MMHENYETFGVAKGGNLPDTMLMVWISEAEEVEHGH
jgi:hypothetical protein